MALEVLMTTPGWSVLHTYATGFEADFAIAQLEANEIPAVRDNHESTALFGLGFQGATKSGYSVLVPTVALEEARALLEPVDDTSDLDPEYDAEDETDAAR
jgi:hypothetical protein